MFVNGIFYCDSCHVHNNNVKKYLISEDCSYLPYLAAFSPLSFWSPYPHFLCNSSLSSPWNHFNFQLQHEVWSIQQENVADRDII